MVHKFSINTYIDLILDGYNLGHSYEANPGLIVMPWAAEKYWTGENLFRGMSFRGESLKFNSELEMDYNDSWIRFLSSISTMGEEEFNYSARLHKIGNFGNPMRDIFSWRLSGKLLVLEDVTDKTRLNTIVELEEQDLRGFVSDFKSFAYKRRGNMPAVPGLMRTLAGKLREL